MTTNELPNKDEALGRAKKAAGELLDDDELKEEGEVDETAGKAKATIDDIAEKTSDAVDGVVDRLTGS